MFFKIAINNVKRSFKDYFIYFLTLTFAVCIFYSFNSIESQSSMLKMGLSTGAFMSTINKFIAGVSIFVSFILGGLITYANNFLIKKRKKELGIYMTLGMPKNRISKILVLETLLIGLMSLAVGISLGIIVSQGLSVITAKLLAVDMEQYRFIVSISAVIKSVAYFGIIFFLVIVFNQITISKYKLIDMLNASKKNEEIKVDTPFVSAIIFILSMIILGTAYYLVLKVGLDSESILIVVSILMGIIGTLLCFFSLSSFFIHMVQRNKKVYLKDLNIFVLRQLHNKINTNFLSMSVICLMLFLTITLLFTMFGFKGSYDRMLEGNTSFDASSSLIANKDSQSTNEIKEYLDIIDFEFESYEKHSFFSEYKLNITSNDLLSNYLSQQEKIDFNENYLGGALSAVKLSEYNSIIQLKGQAPIDLKDGEVLVVSNYGQMNSALDEFMKNENIINIDGKDYSIKNEVPIKENIMTTAAYLNFFYLIIPDNFTGDLELESTGFNVVFDDEHYDKSEEKFFNLFNDFSEEPLVIVFGNTIDQVHARAYGSTAMIIFLGIYLGIVFLISSAAVLALQQLSDASESLERYKALKKIGVTEKMINDAILKQNLIYFMAPLTLAIIHSTVGILVVNKIIRTYSQGIIGSSLLIIGLSLAIIYGGYFYATYVGFKNIIKNSN